MGELQNRYVALDVFRGITVCFMIIVNSPGSWDVIYGPFAHASWHGFTPTDLVFPSFLFAVGNALAFVMPKLSTDTQTTFWLKILKRSFIIFTLGFLMYWFPFFEQGHLKPIEETRIMGVLQRIALCYLFASLVIRYASEKFVIAFSFFCLIIYWLLSYRFGDAYDPYSIHGNAALKLDLLLLGKNHLYTGEGFPFDPEGLLSTLPALVNVLAGYLCGSFIKQNGNTFETLAKLLLVGCVFISIALVWNNYFPINKKLWTSSYVLLTVGLDLIILSTLIYVIEMMNYKKWTSFFHVFGRNPLVIYLFSEIFLITLYLIPVGDNSLQGEIYSMLTLIMSPINASLAFALLFMMVCWMVGYVLDRNKIYIKV